MKWTGARETTNAVFYEFDEEGKESGRRAYDYPASYVHDLVVTENYYILFDCPIKIDFPAVFTKYIFESRACPSSSAKTPTDAHYSVFSRAVAIRERFKPLRRITGATRTTT